MFSITTTPFQYSESKEFHPPVVKKPDSPLFSLQHVYTDTAADVKKVYSKTVAATLSDWRDIITRRLKASEGSIGSDELYLSDKKLVEAYNDLLDTTDTYVTEFIRKKEQRYTHILILTDADARIQAVASLIIKDNSDRVVVETLISAPWNVPMNSEVQSEHKSLSVKGAGTTMMRQIYELAVLKEKKKVELRPLDSARSFYVDGLKMLAGESARAVHFVVSPYSVPEKLHVSSGNLLENVQTGMN